MRLSVLAISGFLFVASAAEPKPRFPPPTPRYAVRVEENVRMAMRDGIKLSTDVYFAQGAGEKLPGILIRTPYNKKSQKSAASMFAGQGYIVAVQDVRGKYESEGKFIVSAADTNDGFDAVNWMATQPWSTGKVGTYGCSYLGEDQLEMSKLKNPNHVAMIPQAAGGAYRYAGLLNGGAVELAMASGWFRTQGSKLNPAPKPAAIDSQAMWATLPMIEMLKRVGAPPSDFEGFVSHQPGDPWWDQFGYINEAHRFNAPALQVCSWYDSVVKDTLDAFNLLRKNAETTRARDNQFVIISPTTHCKSESATAQTVVGKMNLGDAQFDYYNLYVKWFDHWLKDVANDVTSMPKVQLYVMGKNQWRSGQEWPLRQTKFTKYYLHSDGRANTRSGSGTLSTAPSRTERSDSFTYDPKDPVPTAGGAICCTGAPNTPEGPLDQSSVEDRPDVLVYTTPVLEKGIEVTGPLTVQLYVSSTARDTDFTAKLVDVHPDGTAYNLQEGILRARYREGFQKKVWMRPGEVFSMKIDLQATSNYFAPGHRIRLEISSSNFPRFDRNLNTGGSNFDETTGAIAKNEIHHAGPRASYIMLPIIP